MVETFQILFFLQGGKQRGEVTHMIIRASVIQALQEAEEAIRIAELCDRYDEDEASREDSRYLWGE